MREQSTSPQLPLPNMPSAPVIRANAADSLASSVASPVRRKVTGQRSRSGSTRYTAVWAVLGVAAAVYAGALLVGQEPFNMVAGRWLAQERDNTEVAAALARTQSEVAQLQRSVGALEADMSRVKTQATQAETREQAAAARVDAVESRVERIGAQIAQVFAKGSAAPKGGQPQAVAGARSPGAAIETGALPPKETPPATRELAAARHAPAAPEAAAPVPTPPTAAILLARGPSLDALRLSWSLLNERHKSALGALEPRVVTPEPGTHQLIAGPFASAADAAKACAALKARGVTCQPAEFKGEAL